MPETIREWLELKRSYEAEGTQFGRVMAHWCQLEADALVRCHRSAA